MSCRPGQSTVTELRPRCPVNLCFLVWGVLMISNAIAEYLDRPMRFIVPSAAGSAADVNARLLAAELTKQMGQQVVVDNRQGAAGNIGMQLIARAAHDGYTIGYGTSAGLAILIAPCSPGFLTIRKRTFTW